MKEEVDLKSNMDRFIVVVILKTLHPIHHLKSNMDRFIDVKHFLIRKAKII